MAKVALITDTHFGIRQSNKTFIDFFDKFYSNIFFPYLEENNIDRILHLGDIVDHRKFINYIALHSFRKQFIFPIVENNIQLDVIIGNHDIPFRNSNEINAMSELIGGVYPNIRYYSSPETIDIDGTKIAMLPWINNTNFKDSMKFIDETPANILCGHLELNGFEMHKGMLNQEGLSAEVFSKFDQVYSGHFHTKSSRGNIMYLGNPYPLTWNDWGDERGFHILDTETRELTFIKNPYNIFHKFYYNDSDKTIEDFKSLDFSELAGGYMKVIVEKKTNPYWFDILIDNMYKANFNDIKILDDTSSLENDDDDHIDEAADTISILSKFVDNLDTNTDKQNLHKLILELYNDAQNVEYS